MKVIIIGRTGQVGQELALIAWPPNFRVELWDRALCDLADPPTVRSTVRQASPDLVINAAAYTAVDLAETEGELAGLTNCEGPAALAQACSESGAALIHISTDYVFDGTKAGAYRETDAVCPLSEYGRTKLDGELRIAEALDRHVVLRTSWVFSSHGRNFVTTMLGLGSGQNEVRVVADQTGAPTSARDIATTVAAIASRVSDGSGVWGTFHFASLEPVTWHGFAEAIFKAAGRIVKVIPITTIEFGARAMRPANSVLDCTHIFDAYGIRQPSWRAALNDVIAELNPAAST